MDKLSHAQLSAILEDTQESLAAAFARVEAFRLANRQLKEEVAALRNQVHGQSQSSADAPNLAVPSQPCSIDFPQARDAQDKHAAFSGRGGGTVLVSEVQGEHPVALIVGGKKTPVNLVVGKDFFELVESKGRVYAHEFVGMTATKMMPTVRQPAPGSPSGGLLCCFAPPAQREFDDMLPAPQESGRESQGGNGGGSGDQIGAVQILWNKDNVAQRMVIEASATTRQSLNRLTERWLGVQDSEAAEAGASKPPMDPEHDVLPPSYLTIGPLSLTLSPASETSAIMRDDDLRALASGVPPLQRLQQWHLAYSPSRHGISLSTLYRKSGGHVPTLLVVKDASGYIFGCYSEDGWRAAPRFYGSGETFVFQLEPHRVMYPWRSVCDVKNDFFQYGTLDCLAVGGLGKFAIHLAEDLIQGSSGTCGTFGSPCLASREEFKVSALEVWQASS